MKDGLTKQGYTMNVALKAKVVQALAERQGEALMLVARRVGVSRRTLGDYMTKDILAAAAALREEMRAPSVELVDRAMLAQACKGNVAAARLVYMRMAQRGEVGKLLTLDEMEAELETLKARELTLGKGLDDGEDISDDAAVVVGQTG